MQMRPAGDAGAGVFRDKDGRTDQRGGAAGDAVRFNWDWLRGSLQYIIERDYSPVESDSAERLVEGTPLARQADVITAWLKR